LSPSWCVAEAATQPRDFSFTSEASDEGTTLAAALRARLAGQSWNAVRRLCETGKVRVDGAAVLDPAQRLGRGAEVSLKLSAPRPRVTVPGFAVAFEDPHLIIIEKPSGISSVPYDQQETGTAMDLIRDHWRQGPRRDTKHALFIVHRLDKDTSGLLCFAKTRAAERGLHTIFQKHLATRSYLALAEGAVSPGRIESRLVADRGDGLRGSTRKPANPEGQRAVTHVDVIEHLPDSTLCQITLETGRTHQIRIHLSERGHPIVGDTVYCRDLLRAGGRPLPSSRLMLHARQLGFVHPIEGQRLDFTAEPPDDFAHNLADRRAARPNR
jgi:23S rRNA pseudouridine1911/1915/1917 synthase